MSDLTSELVVRPAHLQLALNLSDARLCAYIRTGQIPPPDGRDIGALKLWRLDTIRTWNPDIADAIAELLTIPAFAPRPQRTTKTAFALETA